jgi:tRNA (guanine-N1)-methyltransferase
MRISSSCAGIIGSGPARSRSFHYERNLYWRLCIIRGELGALVLSDALIRLIPGVLSDETSALTDSFQDGLLSGPIYTRPADYKGWKVPEVLTSGNFAKIDKWRDDMAYEHTKTRPIRRVVCSFVF